MLHTNKFSSTRCCCYRGSEREYIVVAEGAWGFYYGSLFFVWRDLLTLGASLFVCVYRGVFVEHLRHRLAHKLQTPPVQSRRRRRRHGSVVCYIKSRSVTTFMTVSERNRNRAPERCTPTFCDQRRNSQPNTQGGRFQSNVRGRPREDAALKERSPLAQNTRWDGKNTPNVLDVGVCLILMFLAGREDNKGMVGRDRRRSTTSRGEGELWTRL